MIVDELRGARWISRAVPAGERIARQTDRSRVEWAEPGRTLAQTFRADGPVIAVNVDLVGPGVGTEPFETDVAYVVELSDADGRTVAARRSEGPQLVWDRFGPLLDVEPAAPPGEYTVTLRVERGTVGWWTADAAQECEDDGVSPLPIVGTALRDGTTVPGVRTIGVDTTPAPNPVFSTTFTLDDVPRRATLAAVVLGVGHVVLNGTRVGAERLEPAVTDYDRTVLHRTWEVGHLLQAGDNEVVIHAGRDRYSARGGDVWGWSLAPWHREPTAIARLEVEDAAGRVRDVVTDESWLTAPGPVRSDMLFRGEDWVIGGPDPAWAPATVVSGPRGVARLSDATPVHALAPVAPLSTERVADSTVHDFGAVMVGRIRCRVSGPAGARVRVVAGEQRDDDGRVICDNPLAAGEAQVDTVTLAGDVVEHEWEPQFGYRGFRWMEVTVDGGAEVTEVRAVPLYSPLDRHGAFACDEPVLEWIDAATARTFRNNLHGIPTDTPIYEKNGWTADAHLATEALLHHFDLRGALGKWMADHRDAQAPDGSMPQIIPTPGWGRASDPAWSSSAVLIPWYLYREHGDLEILEDAVDSARRYGDDLIARLTGGLWPERSWADWLPPGHMLAPEGMAPTGTLMTVQALQHVAAILDAVGHGDAEEYVSHALRVGEAYHRRYFDEAQGVHRVDGVGYRQSMSVLPLAFGIVPEAHVGTVQDALVRDIEGRTDGHVDCGAIAVRHLLPVLSAAGRDDLAVTVLTRRTPPGWGAWYAAGETTLLESWDADARSRNHYFLGSVSSWIQQRVGGLHLTEPGWRRFEVAPVDDPRVRRASIEHITPLGRARVAWERGVGGWRLDVTVPDGAVADVRVGGRELALEAGEHPAAGVMSTLLYLLQAFGLVALIAAAALVATLVVAEVKRSTRTIATMKTTGATSRQVAGVFLSALMAVSATGMVIGIALGMLGTWALSAFAFQLLNLDASSMVAAPWVYPVQAVVALVVPVAAVMVPLTRLARVPVRALVGGAARTPARDPRITRVRTASGRARQLGVRNALRQPGRLALTVASLAVGAAAVLTALNTGAAWDRIVSDEFAANDFHVQVTLDAPVTDGAFGDGSPGTIAAAHGLTRVEYWNATTAELSTSAGAVGDTVTVLSAPQDSTSADFPLVDGRRLAPGDTHAAVISQSVTDPEVGVGDRIALGGDGATWTVVGIVRQLSGGEDGVVWVSQPLESTPAGASGMLRVAGEGERQALEAVESMVAGEGRAVVSAVTATDAKESLDDHLFIITGLLLVMAVSLGVVGLLALVEAMSTAVRERGGEFALMRTVGADARAAGITVVTEALVVAALATAAALILAAPLTAVVEAAVGEIFVGAALPYTWWPAAVGIVAIGLAGAASTAAISPAYAAADLSVREVLATERGDTSCRNARSAPGGASTSRSRR